MSFATDVLVRFAHIDAAGIVFYPRYFEMLNGAVEDWFAAMGHDFASMHLGRHIGVPTVKLEAEFVAPSLLGDQLTIAITPQRVGRSSCPIDFVVTCDGEVRLRASAVLVCMDLKAKKSMPWPEALLEQLNGYCATV
ncbi:MAG: thioesterase family protein [Sphingobium sp.]